MKLRLETPKLCQQAVRANLSFGRRGAFGTNWCNTQFAPNSGSSASHVPGEGCPWNSGTTYVVASLRLRMISELARDQMVQRPRHTFPQATSALSGEATSQVGINACVSIYLSIYLIHIHMYINIISQVEFQKHAYNARRLFGKISSIM